MTIPIKLAEGITLAPTGTTKIARVVVASSGAKKSIPWDRYVRLNAASNMLKGTESRSVLDAGGYDGALAFFLQDATVDLIDPATTGGTILNIECPDQAYDAVAAIDVLEHIPPELRGAALTEISRVARKNVVLNYPCRDSLEAQRLMLKLTNNALIREHVEWELPDSDWVIEQMRRLGFETTVHPHSSVAIWLGQYLATNRLPDAADDLNSYLVDNHADEQSDKPLYHLLHCSRSVN